MWTITIELFSKVNFLSTFALPPPPSDSFSTSFHVSFSWFSTFLVFGVLSTSRSLFSTFLIASRPISALFDYSAPFSFAFMPLDAGAGGFVVANFVVKGYRPKGSNVISNWIYINGHGERDTLRMENCRDAFSVLSRPVIFRCFMSEMNMVGVVAFWGRLNQNPREMNQLKKSPFI